MVNLEIAFLLLVWIISIFFIIQNNWQKRNTSGGFTIIYTINLFLIYGFAALLYMLPWHRYISGEWMLLGFREATFGIGAFAVGNLILSHFFISLLGFPQPSARIAQDPKIALSSPLPKRYFIIGLVSFLVLPRFLIGLPTITSIMAAGQQLLVVGLCLLCWQSWQKNDMRRLRRWLYISLSLPLVSIFFHGFMGVGVVMSLVILLFMGRYIRPRPQTIAVALAMSYIVISFYLTYMRDRADIRENLRLGGSLNQRMAIFKNTLTHPLFFSPFNLEQLELVDERMNQNILAGRAVEHINAGNVDFARGETIQNSLIALIPRAFWPEKSITAGGVATVSKYTGMHFQSETSVGVGQVMEFYINFGRTGVVVGFALLGVIIAIVDLMSGYYLNNYNVAKFMQWFLPGMCFLTVGGELVEVTASIGASIFLAYLISSRNLFIMLLLLYFITQVLAIFGKGGLLPF